ncbi:MAG: amidase [Reyranella sp.]|uniref:amidase n=1 Tax=Reyranella sp. TaxID=1929291 RepID=UPI0027310FF8|nr:amidase [Reyranella sp.]MDP1961779.1 amidase [Reyranella sp.]MDP2375749.1 amidase [Reyranella sp.]
MQDFAGRPVADFVRAFTGGTVAARDIVEGLLARCRRAEPFNPIATLDADGARATADALDARRTRGAEFGALAAVPVSAKDLILTKGLRTAFASLTMKDNVPMVDASAIGQWKAADAVLFAKTTTPEFGHKVLTDSRLHGITRNPWNREHTSGGSSGGAAVSVALGLGPIAMSTDGAGSGRIPAACCGVYGLKATLGRVPHEVPPDQFGQLTYLGVMARHPADLGAGLASMSRGHPDDPWTAAIGRTPFAWPQDIGEDTGQHPIAGKRITVIRRMTGGYLDPDTEARLDAALAFLDRQGARIREMDGREIDWKLDVARIILRANQIERFGEMLKTRRGDLDVSFAKTLDEGEAIDVVMLRRALVDRTTAYKSVQKLFADCDLLLTPTVATPAPLATQDQFAPLVVDGKPIGDLRSAWYTYTIPFNMTGHPAISIPYGRSKAGLPIGLQFVAPWFAEAHLIALAEAFDAETHASAEFPPGFAP